MVGLEPTSLAARDFESRVFASFTTSAFFGQEDYRLFYLACQSFLFDFLPNNCLYMFMSNLKKIKHDTAIT